MTKSGHYLVLTIMGLLSGCQVIHLKESNLSSALKSKNESILTDNNLSHQTQNLLYLVKESETSCLQNFNVCLNKIQGLSENSSREERYAALSEIYLAKALDVGRSSQCNVTLKSNSCVEQELALFDKSLRYSYVYLFDSEESPFDRVFDHRQNQVRIFYNVALSKLMTTYFNHLNTLHFPPLLKADGHEYHVDFDHAVDVQHIEVDTFRSSYNMNFSGFNTVNRKDGLGAEFIVGRKEHDVNHGFILDPDAFYAHQSNPNIHLPRFFPVTAIAYPKQKATADQVIDGAELEIAMFDPYRQDRLKVEGVDYPLTANYSAPYGLWLSKYNLGAAGYWSLINKEANLIMPHLYMLEPFNPNKKIIVFIHGLASSPEAWVSLTNDIMGDAELRQNYQVWQVFYSTNMPIFESRFQIYSLLNQAFQNVAKDSYAAHDAVLVGHSMGGVISRLLVSDADVSDLAMQKMNEAQLKRLKENPVIRERFQFKDLPYFKRVVFVSAPHHGTDYADRWFTQIARRIIRLPADFFIAVEMRDEKNTKLRKGLIENGASNLSRSSNFMQLTQAIQPSSNVVYHSIMGNINGTTDKSKMSDGIVPYQSSHLGGEQSELIIKGGHSIQTSPEAILELRRILRLHLKQSQPSK
ncbi:alpha/beta hydrolase [Acinetobacter baumannii]|uniref:lipase family alpha/beta hydrolase n=1 Tax=Acinetobacter baumannii TaxID=470 RepID=UPI0008DEA49E|nr:alpha/beta fold hydrolase [Acinetobacter baumannii]OIG79278.1 alpha/beta hydrolase [Acinetobacter baumannii]